MRLHAAHVLAKRRPAYLQESAQMNLPNGQSFFEPKKEKKRIGRPPLTPRQRRSSYLRVNLRQKEARKCEKIAKKQGMSFSAWARSIILDAVSSAK